nr:PREDICTED: vacuolar protein sorting-associated protein 13A-like isoform X1 [Bemisia tabaci]
MFKGVVATLLNRYFGKYVEDLDIENLNVGIFSGDVQLQNLKLKPEAFYELELPIEVKVGLIEKVSVNIPWTGFQTSSIKVLIEGVYIIVGPVTDRPYDSEKDKRLLRAFKRRKIELLEDENLLGTDAPETKNFLENLITTIMNNLQISIHNVHVRYEDSGSSIEYPLAVGICLQSFSIQTTNSKWKPTVPDSQSSAVYQLIRIESFSVYCNPTCSKLVSQTEDLENLPFHVWCNSLRQGLESFSVEDEKLDLIIKPISGKIKLIVNKSKEGMVPKLLVDFVIQDAAIQCSKFQYVSILEMMESFHRININRKYRIFHPYVPVSKNTKQWWNYAFKSVAEAQIRPYTWHHIKQHRLNYRNYRDVYKKTLLEPTNSELKLDLQILEDTLSITDIIIAREHAKILLRKEFPERVAVLEKGKKSWLTHDTKTFSELVVLSEKGRGLWSQLSTVEKTTLFDAIGYSEKATVDTIESEKYVEHKFNFTIANFSVSLINRGNEILVLTLTHFLVSLEVRPAVNAFKLSTRTDNLMVEGVSIEKDLVPVVTSENLFSGHSGSNFLALDFQKNPLNADYEVTLVLGATEVFYNEFVIAELMNFIQAPMIDLKSAIQIKFERVSKVLLSLTKKVLGRQETVQLNLDLQLPYLILPEFGSAQKVGNLLIIDPGHLVLKTELELNDINLEDATQMEIEEKLYDRFYLDVTDFQLLFVSSKDDWKSLKSLPDSQVHIVAKTLCQIVLSNSLRPDYRQLPKHKLNINFKTLKLNLSDQKIGAFLDFSHNFPLPSAKPFNRSFSNSSAKYVFDYHEVLPGDPSTKELQNIKHHIVAAELKITAPEVTQNCAAPKLALLNVDKSFISSDLSDEDMELWACKVDLPGFDDNISPNNLNLFLFRFVISQIAIDLNRSSDNTDKGYLQLKIEKFCLDVAVMEYGPAMQASIYSISILDLLHKTANGESLKLLLTESSTEFASLLYRKVSSNCPDFKTHFHNVEQSLVLDFSKFSLTFHRGAFITLHKFLQYVIQKVKSRLHSFNAQGFKSLLDGCLHSWHSKPEAPIPPGATKFSYSIRFSELFIRLCNADSDFLDFRLGGFETDCTFKANERMILRVYLMNIGIDELSGCPLYHKVLSMEGDKVLDLRYVRHNPRFYEAATINCKRDDVKSDGKLKLHLEKIQIVFLKKNLVELQHFMEPFIKPGLMSYGYHHCLKMVKNAAASLRTCSTRLHFSILIHAPVLVLPQNSLSPNGIFINLGDLSIENFFKEAPSSILSNCDHNSRPIIDNILIKLSSLTMSRAIMMLNGTLVVQEPLVEPFNVILDVKRSVAYHNFISCLPNHYLQSNQLLFYKVTGNIDPIIINLDQKDLSTILSIWSDNFCGSSFLKSNDLHRWHLISPFEHGVSTGQAEDHNVRKLQAFLYQHEQIRKEISFSIGLDSLQLCLYSDTEEMLSSPIRDLNHALCKLEMREASCLLDVFSDRSEEMKASLQSCVLLDIRLDNSSAIKKIFQSHSCSNLSAGDNINVSTPPIIDVTYRQTSSGDRCLDILVERTRLNLSVSFLIDMIQFIMEALPSDKQFEGGIINPGFVAEVSSQKRCQFEGAHLGRPSSADSTSEYFSSGASWADSETGLSLSIKLRRPEIMLFTTKIALLVRTEFLLDYSRHSGRESLVCSLSGLHILSKIQNNLCPKSTYLVLNPCDIEVEKTLRFSDEGMKITTCVSSINLNLSTTIVQTVVEIVNEVCDTLRMNDDSHDLKELCGDSDYENLWCPKKISPSLYFDALNTNICCNTYCPKLNESFTIFLPKIRVLFEVEDFSQRIPVLLLTAKFETNMKNWSSELQLKMELLLEASCYNGDKRVWEPVIEPVSEVENVYRPWRITMKVLTAKAYPLSNHLHLNKKSNEKDRSSCSEVKSSDSRRHKSNSMDSDTSDDESGCKNGSMIFIRKHHGNSLRPGKQDERNSLIGFPEDSDSENENAVIEKLANAVGHLFTGESLDSESSDQENSSEAEHSIETEEETENEVSVGASTVVGTQERTVFLNNRSDSLDSGLEPEMQTEKTATYFIIEAKDSLEISLSSNTIRVLTELMDAYITKTPLPQIRTNQLSLHNDIAPDSVITLFQRTKGGGSKVLIRSSYSISDSTPSGSQSGSVTPDTKNSGFENDIESFEGGFAALSSNEKTLDGEVNSNFELMTDTITNLYKKVADYYLHINVPGFDVLRVLCPQRTVSKFHLLQPIKNNTRYYISLDIQANEFKRVIHVRSPLQVKNDTQFPIGLYYKKENLSALGYEPIGESINPFDDFNRIAILEPDQTYTVPLLVAYHCHIFVMPTYVESYHVSETGLWWQEMASQIQRPVDLVCKPKLTAANSFSIRAICVENVAASCRACRAVPNFTLHLLPSVTIFNRLPLSLRILLPAPEQALEIEPGGKAVTHCFDLSKLNKVSVEVVNYLGCSWCGSFNLTVDVVEKTLMMTQSQQDNDTDIKQMFLNAHIDRIASCNITLFTQYWIANKTELFLQVRASSSDSVLDIKGEGPLFFCYRKQRQRTIRLRANESSWSSAFSIDTLNCPGIVICRDKERNKSYRILMNISTSSSSPHLTKVIKFLPNFLVSNQCFRPLRFMENNEKADLWFDLQHGQSVPFWPETESMSMFVKFTDSKLVSQHFSICTTQQTVLRMDKGTGLVVDVSGGETKPFTILFRRYYPGDAPLRIDNLCQDLFLKIHQQYLGQVALLSPCQSLLYTWDDPAKDRVLVWNVYNKKCSGFYANFGKDGYGQERVSFHMVKPQNNQQTLTAVGAKLSAGLKKLSVGRREETNSVKSSSSDDSDLDEKPQLTKKTRKDKVMVYWVSYLEGFQRVLLFTQDEKLAFQMRKKIDFEKSNMELFFSLKGIGISLIHERNSRQQEVVYLNILDSAALWEVCVAHRWKLLTLELASWVEASWLSGSKKAQLKDYVQIDFEKMQMTKPFFGELRRFYNPAVWFQLRKSDHYIYWQCKIHKLQVDNQLPEAIFPVVLYSVATPLPVLRKTGPKPCINVSAMKRNQPIQSQTVFKFLRASFQEFMIQLDRDFISSVFLLLSPLIKEEKPSIRIRHDIAAMHQPVVVKNVDENFSSDRTIIEQIAIPPLNFIVSYSQTSSDLNTNSVNQALTNSSYAADILFYVLEVLAPLINDIKSVRFRTMCFKQYGISKNLHTVLRNVAQHYSTYLMQQLYVNVLEWDVLSSPYSGSFRQSSEEASLNFMEQRELEDVDELSEGLCTSAKCLMGHIVGCSTASALIMSTCNDSNSSMLSFNEDSKKKNVFFPQQSTLPGFIVSANNTLELGVMLGFSGVTVKHSAGTQQGGIDNFFRGAGKGLFTLLSQPSVQVGDVVEMSKNSIRRAAEMGEEIILRSRLPRHINPYFGVRPFSLFESTGTMLLHSLSKGHYINTDHYWGHAPLQSSGKICLLITLQHIFLLQKPRQWGTWEIDWLIRIDDIMQVPTVNDHKLVLQVRQDQNLPYASSNEIIIPCDDNSTLVWLQKQIEAVIILSMEDKPFSDVEIEEETA